MIEVGLRIDLLECVDISFMNSAFSQNWQKELCKVGEQVPHLFFSEHGYCSFNFHINSSDYAFNKAFKKIGTFVITKIK